MRAGVLPPATPHAHSLHRPRQKTFNEGRGLTPGDARPSFRFDVARFDVQ